MPSSTEVKRRVRVCPARAATRPRAIELAGNKLAIPAQDGVWPGYGGDVAEGLAAEPMTDLAQRTSLGVRDSHATQRSPSVSTMKPAVRWPGLPPRPPPARTPTPLPRQAGAAPETADATSSAATARCRTAAPSTKPAAIRSGSPVMPRAPLLHRSLVARTAVWFLSGAFDGFLSVHSPTTSTSRPVC